MPTPEAAGGQERSAVDHLAGTRLPDLPLPATDGRDRSLAALGPRTVVFAFPSIGGPAGELLDEWKAVPGAYGCTAEACGFRDELGSLRSAGADVLGLSAQPPEDQRSAVARLDLPYPLLSDDGLRLADSLGLPSFEFHGRRYLVRLTLVIRDGVIEAALYPVSPPDRAAEQALQWLRRTASRAG